MKTLFTAAERRSLQEMAGPSPAAAADRYQEWKRDIGTRGRNWAVALATLSTDPEERKRLEDIVGLKVLAAGAERVVFDQGRTVLKVASGGSESLEANEKEHALWVMSKSYPDLRAVLVPVVAAAPDGRWLVMEKARSASGAGEVPASSPVRLYDVKSSNWGKHKGSLKLLDYSMWSKVYR